MSLSHEAALFRARSLLGGDPATALEQARLAFKAAPGAVEAALILGIALRRSGDPDAAHCVLAPLLEAHPQAWGLHFEAGAALACLGRTTDAITALTRAVALNPQSSLAWHALGDQLAIAGDQAGAEAAQIRPVPGFLGDPQLNEAAKALFDGRLDIAVLLLRDRFNMHLTDVIAVRMLADAGLRMGRNEQVEAFLAPYLHRAPDFLPLRHGYAVALHRQQKLYEARVQVEQWLERHPSALALYLKAALLVQVGDCEPAIEIYTGLLAARPDQPKVWLSYGHVLKTVGRQADAVAAYRRSLALAPELGEAYWSLANLKVVRFEPDDVEAMRASLDRRDLGQEDRIHLHFALGKALEDMKRFEPSFDHYRQGAALRRAVSPYDAAANRDCVRRTIATFTPEALTERTGVGDPARNPIFIVGLPRSGSTLVEQMLSSHSKVEGVSELAYLTAIAQGAARSAAGEKDAYPSALLDLEPSDFKAMGGRYLSRVSQHRRLDRPLFIDKFPNNFMHIGLIQLILPNARIIDVRRHPMACCFSGFKQHYAHGQSYSYDLADIGRYYGDYIDLMTHFDRVLPGRIHSVRYETLVEDPEAEIRRLLEYCGLEFEPSCLRFYESSRPVRTASSEQVRQPIFSDGLDHWRNFEPWLQPLKTALGAHLQGALGEQQELQ